MTELLEKAEFCYESLCVSYSDHELIWVDFIQQEEELDQVITSFCQFFPEILEFIIEKMDPSERLYYYINTRIFLQLEQKDFLTALVMKLNWSDQELVLGVFDALCHSEISDTRTLASIVEPLQIKQDILKIYQILIGLKDTLDVVTKDNLVYVSRYNLIAEETDINLMEISDDLSLLDVMYLCRFNRLQKEIMGLVPKLVGKNKWHYLSAALLHANEYLISCWSNAGNCNKLKQALALEGTPGNYDLLLSSLKEDNDKLTTANCMRFLSGKGRKIWQHLEEEIPEDELMDDEKGKGIKIIREVEDFDCSYEYWQDIGEENNFWQGQSSLRWGTLISCDLNKQLLNSSIPGLWRYYILFSDSNIKLCPIKNVIKQKEILED
ncbi:MAG: hypothetical protein K9N06_02945 [Candidatus Cloacimonetes bacterium]|nr:hypothetical protein [Candidatus Cloacimonadota bacterium]